MINAHITNTTSYPTALNNEERSSTYAINIVGDDIPPCRTPLVKVKTYDISASHLMHNSFLVYQNISILTTRV